MREKEGCAGGCDMTTIVILVESRLEMWHSNDRSFLFFTSELATIVAISIISWDTFELLSLFPVGHLIVQGVSVIWLPHMKWIWKGYVKAVIAYPAG